MKMVAMVGLREVMTVVMVCGRGEDGGVHGG
jgi:hypothetical protein